MEMVRVDSTVRAVDQGCTCGYRASNCSSTISIYQFNRPHSLYCILLTYALESTTLHLEEREHPLEV